ncbi:MAG: hypothetical protein IJ445_05245 [Clostridia bacterium]|nr:hypothetical protein [Clostridia bacterium]
MIIAFTGHSFIASKNKIKSLVKEQIKNNITDKEPITCYLGGYGDFDEICAIACVELKKEFTNIEIAYITPYVSLTEQVKSENTIYDVIIYPPLENVLPKFAISKRNEWMMTNADLVIAYVNCDYGGAYRSLTMAKRKGKKIINISDFL